MTHILFISRYYSPEKAAAAVCVSEMAKRLVKMGYEVTVLTTVPNYPTGIVPSAYRGCILQIETIDGVRVIRVWSYVSPNTGFFRRVLSHLSFGCLAPFIGNTAIGKPDLIIVESPPLFNVLAAHLLTYRQHIPFIFWVADLWPESAIQLGILRNKLWIMCAQWLEWYTYRHACRVWTVTSSMSDALIKQGLAREHIFLITNGVDTTRFFPQSQEQARTKLGWGHKPFIVLYAGTHGLTHGLMTILIAAKQLQHYAEIQFVLVGNGADKAALLAYAQRHQLHNVRFLDPQPHAMIPTLINAANVCLAHTKKLPLFEGMLPMKMYEAMACARPLLLALNGEACRIAVEEAKAAIHIEPENAHALANAVLHLYQSPSILQKLGHYGRDYIQGRFDYDTLAEQLHAQLNKLHALPEQHLLSPFYLLWHKIIDLTFGLLGVALLIIILPVLALLISLDSPGTIFYSQERLGLNEKPFRIYKFRSMYMDAEQNGRARWAQKKDPRITRVGSFLRATHLDELPQVWNILQGDMSLIGPRPERAAFVFSLKKMVPCYSSRLSIKPGLTGWAQVNYVYSNSVNDALIKLRYDLYYIQHRSLILDIVILCKTVREVMCLRGI